MTYTPSVLTIATMSPTIDARIENKKAVVLCNVARFSVTAIPIDVPNSL